MNVRDIMIKDILMIDKGYTVADAMREMFDRRVTSLIVETGGEDGYGIITRRDIVAKVIAKDKDPGKVKVKDVMSEPLQTVSPDEDIKDVAALMARSDIRRFPVMDGGRLVGLISSSDILKAETLRGMKN